VGGTAGAILTCPLEVVKTRLQSSNSGFDTTVKLPDMPEAAQTGTTTCRTLPHKKFWVRPEGGLYRGPVLGPRGFMVNLFSSGHGGQGGGGGQVTSLTDRQIEFCVLFNRIFRV
jgi:hypothetical protein